jgi:HAD superfamily phosphoserine phosphatase-like hydrolase
MLLSRVVLLDIDGTLVSRSLEQQFVQFLLHSHRIKISDLAQNTWALRERPVKLYRMRVPYLRNQDVGIVRAWIHEAWQTLIKRNLFPGWFDAIQWLHSQGITIVLLSGTLAPLADPLMRHFHITRAVCAEPEVRDDHYTGRLQKPHPYAINKFHYGQEWLKRYGMTWDHTIAVGNDWQDRFLLRRCHAVVVRPGLLLKYYAMCHRWKIINDPSDARQIITALQQILETM